LEKLYILQKGGIFIDRAKPSLERCFLGCCVQKTGGRDKESKTREY
jgi:hypothetical protein